MASTVPIVAKYAPWRAWTSESITGRKAVEPVRVPPSPASSFSAAYSCTVVYIVNRAASRTARARSQLLSTRDPITSRTSGASRYIDRSITASAASSVNPP
jgi:hypothetical protein